MRPAEAAEREQDRDQRREGGRDHERYLAEEDDGDDAAGQDAEDVVGQAVALDRVADFELHHRNARQFRVEPGAGEILFHQLADIADRLGQLVAGDHLGFERQHDQRQRAVVGQQLAADDLVGFDRFDEFVVVGALRQFRGEQRRRQLARGRRLARREQRNNSARALDQLQVGHEVAQLLEIGARKQHLAFDHHQHVEFGRREALGFRFVLLVVLGIGAKQLAQRIVDLDAVDTEQRADDQHDENDAGQDRRLHRDQADPLQPERDALGRRLLDHLDMNFIVADFFEHALSSSRTGSSFGLKFLGSDL